MANTRSQSSKGKQTQQNRPGGNNAARRRAESQRVKPAATRVRPASGRNRSSGGRTPSRGQAGLLHSLRAWADTGWVGWTAAIGALLLVVATDNAGAVFNYFGVKLVVLLVLTGFGLPFLVLNAFRSPLAWPARAAWAFLAVGLVSAATSLAPGIGFFGYDQTGTGWLFFVSLAALWALGTRIEENGGRLLERTLLLACLLDALATAIESATAGSGRLSQAVQHVPGLFFQGGQPYGLADNPVFSAELLLGGVALLAFRSENRTRGWWAMTVALVGADFLSGERFGIIVLAALIVWTLIARGRRAGGLFAAAVVGGYALGYVIEKVAGTAHAGIAASQRLTTTSGAFGPRIHEWKASLHAIANHPLIGIGPAQSGQATTPYIGLDSGGQYFFDVHNIVIEIAVTTGILGFLCFAGWLLSGLRFARGPLLLFALVVFAGNLVEPLSIITTSLIFLAFGAAMVVTGEPPAPDGDGGGERGSPWTVGSFTLPRALQPVPTSERRPEPVPAGRTKVLVVSAGVVLALIGLVWAVRINIGNDHVANGNSHSNVATLIAAGSDMPMWTNGPEAAANLLVNQGRTQSNPADFTQAIGLYHQALGRDPSNPTLWSQLGLAHLDLRQYAAAESAYRQSVRWDPWASPGYFGLALVAAARGDLPAMVGWYRHVAITEPTPQQKRVLACLENSQAHHTAVDTAVKTCIIDNGL
ncbi:MAG: O-antigen ligase family protein [Acidimicrobiales bacterium]